MRTPSGPADPNQAQLFRLDLARALAAADQKDKAIGIYQELLKDKVPDMLITQTAQAQLVAMGVSPDKPAN